MEPHTFGQTEDDSAEPGDARHPPVDEQLLAEAAALEARITGDRDPAAAA